MKDLKKKEGNPGPAAYNIPCSIRDVPAHERERGVFDEHFTYIYKDN